MKKNETVQKTLRKLADLEGLLMERDICIHKVLEIDSVGLGNNLGFVRVELIFDCEKENS